MYPLNKNEMTPLFDSMEDFATNGGAITDYELICEMMNQNRQSFSDMIEPEFEDEEYRDEREDSSRLAERHHC